VNKHSRGVERIAVATNQIAPILARDAVFPSLTARSRDQVLREIGARMQRLHGFAAAEVTGALQLRERRGSTAFGHGIAIPHARLASITRVVGLFARLDRPVDFGASDGRGVDLVFALLSPRDSRALHLVSLARIARVLRDPDLCEKLRAAVRANSLHALITEPDMLAAS